MAVDHVETALQSRDRSPGNPAQRAHDAVAGPAARVLSLQRTLGNGATSELLRARQPASALLQRELRGQPNVVSARDGKLNEQRGREILEQFSRNDRSSVADLVGPVPRTALNLQEWGLIRENTGDGEVHLIFGKGGSVVWDRYLDEGTPLAHSHPWRPEEKKLMERIGSIDAAHLVTDRREGKAQEGTPPSVDDALATQRRVTAGRILLPTISDFVLPATRGMTEHTVFTPYAVDDTGAVSRPPPNDATGARLVWELTDIVLDRSDPDKSTHKVTARLTAKRGTNQIWTRQVQAPASDDVDVLKRTSYKVIGD